MICMPSFFPRSDVRWCPVQDLNQQSLNMLTVAAVGGQMVMALQTLGSVRRIAGESGWFWWFRSIGNHVQYPWFSNLGQLRWILSARGWVPNTRSSRLGRTHPVHQSQMAWRTTAFCYKQESMTWSDTNQKRGDQGFYRHSVFFFPTLVRDILRDSGLQAWFSISNSHHLKVYGTFLVPDNFPEKFSHPRQLSIEWVHPVRYLIEFTKILTFASWCCHS